MILDQLFAQIEKQYNAKLPFVAYRKPNTSQLKAMLQTDDTLHPIVDFTESGFVFAPFDSKEDAFLIPVNNSEVFSVLFDSKIFSESEDDRNYQKTTSHNHNASQESDKIAHIKRVESGIEAIQNQCFSKVVLSRRELIANVETHPFEIFKRLLQRYPTAFVSIWYHPKVGMWLGATPETLLSMNGNQLKTMALAGTQAFEGSEDVVWKEKEKEEQQIVTDFIVQRLGSVGGTPVFAKAKDGQAIGSGQPARTEKAHSGDLTVENAESTADTQQLSNPGIKVSEPKTVRAGNLLHLQTEISMRLKPGTGSLKPILDALHPTPAVCGFPKDQSKAYIIENEGYPREFYAGFMGELHLKETISRNPNRRNVENNAYNAQKSVSNLYVNLRCMQIKNKNIYIYIGGGITKDSIAEAEWEETVHKSKVIKSVLQ